MQRAPDHSVSWIAILSAALLLPGGGLRAQSAAVGRPDWATAAQQPDGRWPAAAREGADSSGADVRATALMLLALLGDGSTTSAGRYRAPLRQGFRWLVSVQGADGAFTAASLHDHALATWALATAVVVGSEDLAPAAARAIDHLERHGQPGAPGFDLELAAWRCLVRRAVLAADGGAELRVAEERFDVLRGWLDARRAPPLEATSPLDLAAELTIRFELDRDGAGSDPRVAALRVALLAKAERPLDLRTTFLATWPIFHLGGEGWRRWERGLAGFARSQHREGPFAGTVDPEPGAWGEAGGRVASTALAAMTLGMYYRCSRLVR